MNRLPNGKQNETESIWMALLEQVWEFSPRPQKDQAIVNQGLHGFVELCNNGCDPEVLGSLLSFLAYPRPIKTHKSEFSLRPFDSKKTALNLDIRTVLSIWLHGHRLRAEMSKILDDFRNLEKELQTFQKSIRKLRAQPIVRKAIQEGTIGEGDLLYGSLLSELFPIETEALRGIKTVIESLREVGQKRKPDSTRLRKKIYLYVYEKTGSWCYGELADVLSTLFRDPKISEVNVKQWKHDNKLKQPIHRTRTHSASR